MEYPEFKVCVRCFTYNQSQYITDALKGFVMQQTDFPFVCCIVDDASTDGEQEVIRRYVEDNFDLSDGSCYFKRETDYAYILYAQHKTNTNCFFAVLFLKENHYSIRKSKMEYLDEWREGCEYEAFCEGDDFWIDSKKLQKQVNILDVHTDCSLCFSNVVVLNNETGEFLVDNVSTSAETITTIKSLAKRNFIHTPSVLCRLSNCYSKVLLSLGPVSLGDYPLWLLIAERGKLYKIDDKMVVYRLGSGVWSSTPYIERVIKTMIMLCKLRMVMESDEVKTLLDEQIMSYQSLVLQGFNYNNNRMRKIISRIFNRIRSNKWKQNIQRL